MFEKDNFSRKNKKYQVKSPNVTYSCLARKCNIWRGEEGVKNGKQEKKRVWVKKCDEFW